MFDIKTFDVKKYDAILARGLSNGVGDRGGQMCIEAAICATLDLPHGDDPRCVSPAVREFKIKLNDSNWSSPEARSHGLHDLGIAQLGSLGVISDQEFSTRLARATIQFLLPPLFRELHPNGSMEDIAKRCEIEGTEEAAWAARVEAAVGDK